MSPNLETKLSGPSALYKDISAHIMYIPAISYFHLVDEPFQTSAFIVLEALNIRGGKYCVDVIDSENSDSFLLWGEERGFVQFTFIGTHWIEGRLPISTPFVDPR